LDPKLVFNIADTGARFHNVFGTPPGLAVSNVTFQHDFAIFALDADIGGIHVMSVCQVFVDIFHDSLVRAAIVPWTDAGEGLPGLVRVGGILTVIRAGVRSSAVISAEGRFSHTDPGPAPAVLRQAARTIRTLIANVFAAEGEIGFLVSTGGVHVSL